MLALAGSTTSAQPGRRDPAREEDEGSGVTFGRRGMSNAWNHDYPRAELNLARILRELTLIDVNPEGRILALDDPKLFNYPIV